MPAHVSQVAAQLVKLPGVVAVELGQWGPLVNGGGWLQVYGTDVDVLFRDLDVIDEFVADARQGVFDILLQPGTVVGAPTYLPVGELASCQVLHGQLQRLIGFPSALANAAANVWRGKAGVNLLFARGHAGLSEVQPLLAGLGQTADELPETVVAVADILDVASASKG